MSDTATAEPAAVTNPSPTSVVVKREAVLVRQRMGLAEHKRQDWVIDAEQGTLPDDVMKTEYWAHVAAEFSQWDTVEVREESGAWIMKLRITACDRNWARMYAEAFYDLSKVSTLAPDDAVKYHVVFRGSHKKHCVVRISDGALLQEGFQTKALAEEWLRNHERVTG